jgi:hypothetical protein
MLDRILEEELLEMKATIERFRGFKALVYEMMEGLAQNSIQTLSEMEDAASKCNDLDGWQIKPTEENTIKSKAMEDYVRPNLEQGRLTVVDEIDE